MNEDRRRDEQAILMSGDGAQATPGGSGGIPSTAEDDIAIEEGEPENLGPSRSEPPPPPEPARKRETGRRVRGRMTLRIPDDEVSRPSDSMEAAPSSIEDETLAEAAFSFMRLGVSEISLTVTEANADAIQLYKDEGYKSAHSFDAAVWQRRDLDAVTARVAEAALAPVRAGQFAGRDAISDLHASPLIGQ